VGDLILPVSVAPAGRQTARVHSTGGGGSEQEELWHFLAGGPVYSMENGNLLLLEAHSGITLGRLGL